MGTVAGDGRSIGGDAIGVLQRPAGQVDAVRRKIGVEVHRSQLGTLAGSVTSPLVPG